VNQFHVTIYSHSLYDELATHIPLDMVESGLGCPLRTVNGLALLRHYYTLMRRLRDLRSALCDNPANQSLALEMDLLVNGLLGDGQVFQSFGYENLYELEFMDYQLWKYFQKQKLDNDITELDDGFYAIDDEETLSASGSEFSSTTTFVKEVLADGAVKDLTEPLSDNETQGPFSRPASTNNRGVYILTASHQSNENVLASFYAPISDESQRSLDTEFSLAVRAGDEGMVRLLLDRRADVNEESIRVHTPLSLAARAGDEGMVRLLLDGGADVNRTSIWGHTPLRQAIMAGHEGMVRLLLDGGADVNEENTWGHTLSLAIDTGHEGIVRLLLDRGTDVNGTSIRGHTPLSLAAQAGDEGIVRLLLDRGVDVNGTSIWGDTPLSLAVQAGDEGMVRLLLDRGADVNEESIRGYTPLSLAIDAGHEGILRLLCEANTLNSVSALIMAAKQRNMKCVRRLIREGVDVQTAALYLQGEDGNHMRWLLKAAWGSSGTTNIGRKKNWQSADLDASENIRHLRLKFVGQYMLMTKSAQNSQTRLRDLPQQFHNYREAWTAGIKTMRELSRGETPRSVYNTLAFLSLGRAIVETLRDRKNCDYLEDFEQDLGRWGQLFENAADLEVYKDALNLMWGFVYNEYTSREQGYVDEDTLIHFQELASTLVDSANDLIGSEAFHDRRSEHYQQGRPGVDRILVGDVPHRFSGHRSPEAKSPSQLEAAPHQYLNSSNIFDSMKTDTSSFEPMVVFLVAGAIFAIIVMFLEGTSKR
jgi:ankyrin repeat protein